MATTPEPLVPRSGIMIKLNSPLKSPMRAFKDRAPSKAAAEAAVDSRAVTPNGNPDKRTVSRNTSSHKNSTATLHTGSDDAILIAVGSSTIKEVVREDAQTGHNGRMYTCRTSDGALVKKSESDLKARWPQLLSNFKQRESSIDSSPVQRPVLRVKRSTRTRIESRSDDEDDLDKQDDSASRPRLRPRRNGTTTADDGSDMELDTTPSSAFQSVSHDSGSSTKSPAEPSRKLRTLRTRRMPGKSVNYNEVQYLLSDSFSEVDNDDNDDANSVASLPPARRQNNRRSRRDDADFVVDDKEAEADDTGSDGTEISHREIPEREKHCPNCARCSFTYDPDILTRYLKAASKSTGSKAPRAGSLLDRFPTEDDLRRQGCWMECDTCTDSYHAGCSGENVVKEIKKLFKSKSKDGYEKDPHRIVQIGCSACRKPSGNKCSMCSLGPKTVDVRKKIQKRIVQDNMAIDQGSSEVTQVSEVVTKAHDPEEPIMYRCRSCRRPFHYSCLRQNWNSSKEGEKGDLDDEARFWQGDYLCADCCDWSAMTIDVILAWRHSQSGANATRAALHGEEKAERQDRGLLSSPRKIKVRLPDFKEPFEAAEYLIKFSNQSFGDCTWIPHTYLVAKHNAKLRNFLTRGPLVDLTQYSLAGTSEDDPAEGIGAADLNFGLTPDDDAFDKIPSAWLTPDRILSVDFNLNEVFVEHGDMVKKTLPKDSDTQGWYTNISRAYIKWQDQPYTAATWTNKLKPDSPYYEAFMIALQRFLKFRTFRIPRASSEALQAADRGRAQKKFKELEAQPSYIPNSLLNFQLEGVNFCYYNWHRHHATILADEMGLGKTVQICSLLSILAHKEKKLPFLIVVPNSTLGNWVRESMKWMPDLKVVPLAGTAAMRDVVAKYELFPKMFDGELAAHVVIATYEAAEKGAGLLKKAQRWEAIIVDEGQRLKSGQKSALYRTLTGLNCGHRILMSGTPLNNNLRELFNLLSFIDPENYPTSDLDELEARYAELTAELVDELRGRIRPYMLRRTKATALDLPRLSEIIVPISMRPLQKRVYKDLLKRNTTDIASIFATKKTNKNRASYMNILMQLRKDLGHPFLVMPELEEIESKEGITQSDAELHNNLIEASGKMVFLHQFMPKLKQHGHRTLIFSQFVIFLNILERFFVGEGVKFVRLDGGTSQMDRQIRIDAFNRPDSDIDVFLLSTRAGGAGINLATADTVIIADPDWNPHNDLQAISRAHRYGQKKPVTVFKLMCKGSAEEKIVQVGKRKLALDHLVIQTASEEEVEAATVESILQFGAVELFAESEEALGRDIRHTDKELDLLIKDAHDMALEKVATDADKVDSADKTFAFARVWESGAGLKEMEELQEDNAETQRGFWDRILKENEDEVEAAKAAAEAETGRGFRRRRNVDYIDSDKVDKTPKKKQKGHREDDADFVGLPSSQDDEEFDDGDTIMTGQGVRLDQSDLEVMLDQNKQMMDKALRKEERRRMRLQRRERIAAQNGTAVMEANGVNPHSVPYNHVVQPDVATNILQADMPHNNHNMSHNHTQAGTSTAVFNRLPHQGHRFVKLTPPDVVGKSSGERQEARDRVLRELQHKAKAIQSVQLDQILAEVRILDAKDQTKRLLQAGMLVRALINNRQPSV